MAALRFALERRNISVVVPEDLAPGSNWRAEIDSIISQVDLVIGVLTRERRSDWVLFELGQAWSNGRQVLLIAPTGGKFIPTDLRGLLTLRASLSNQDAIEFALDQLLAAPPPVAEKPAHPRPLRGLGASADVYLRRLEQAVVAGHGEELERLVEAALRESGVETISSREGGDRGVDLAVWSDALQPFVGNPLLIEVKSRLGSYESRSAAVRFGHQLASSGSRWGLLLYGGPHVSLPRSVVPPNVLAMPLTELLERMRHSSFAEVVKDLRNRRVHGTPD